MGINQYLQVDKLPHIWCPGCGHGMALGSLLRAVERLQLNQDRTTIVSGIGCAARASGYLNFDTLHTTHGRALAFATGIKLARPELTVIIITGDGDAAAIGGNHLIHAARRNVDLTTICFNNSIYGMTAGQYSPMTPRGRLASTAPYGTADRAFDLCRLVEAAGATYVARSTAYHVHQSIRLISEAIRHKGFSFVEVLTQCPTYYGRRNRLGTAVDMLEWYRRNAVDVKRAAGMPAQELEGKIITGELHRSHAPEYTEEYDAIIEQARERRRREEEQQEGGEQHATV